MNANMSQDDAQVGSYIYTRRNTMISSLIGLIVMLAVVGVLLYLFNLLVPIEGRIKQVIIALVGLLIFLYILQALGVVGGPKFHFLDS